jgi:hypothetical protein
MVAVAGAFMFDMPLWPWLFSVNSSRWCRSSVT